MCLPCRGHMRWQALVVTPLACMSPSSQRFLATPYGMVPMWPRPWWPGGPAQGKCMFSCCTPVLQAHGGAIALHSSGPPCAKRPPRLPHTHTSRPPARPTRPHASRLHSLRPGPRQASKVSTRVHICELPRCASPQLLGRSSGRHTAPADGPPHLRHHLRRLDQRWSSSELSAPAPACRQRCRRPTCRKATRSQPSQTRMRMWAAQRLGAGRVRPRQSTRRGRRNGTCVAHERHRLSGLQTACTCCWQAGAFSVSMLMCLCVLPLPPRFLPCASLPRPPATVRPGPRGASPSGDLKS